MSSSESPSTDRTPSGLDLRADPAELTAALIDVESVSDHETPLADLVENAPVSYTHLTLPTKA